jgi:hypothetical protein
MPDFNHDRVEQPEWLRPNSDEHDKPSPSGSPDSANQLNLARLAQLVADGQAPLALPLEPSARSSLIRRVSQLRRERLLRFVARAIAYDIHQSRGDSQEHK